jgi:hypothetical protein
MTKIYGKWEKTTSGDIIFHEWQCFDVLWARHLAELASDPKHKGWSHAITNNISSWFKASFRGKLRHGNCIVVLMGPQRSGKSVIMFALYCLDRDTKIEYQVVDPEVVKEPHIITSLKYLRDKVQEPSVIGGFIGSDESTRIRGEGKDTIMDQIANIVEEGSASRTSIVVCCPEMVRVSGCDYALMPIGFNAKGFKQYEETGDSSLCQSKALVYMLERDKAGSTQVFTPMGYVIFNAAEAIKLNDEYAARKTENITNVFNAGGAEDAYSNADTMAMEKLVAAFFERAERCSWNHKKNDMERVLKENPPIPIPPQLQKSYKNTIDARYRMQKEAKLKEEQVAMVTVNSVMAIPAANKFTVDKMAILHEVEAEWTVKYPKRVDEHWIDQYRMYYGVGCYRETQEAIGAKYGLAPNTISTHTTPVQAAMYYKSGRLYEKFIAKRLEDSGEFSEVHCEGSPGFPDVYAVKNNELFIYSCKCYESTRDHRVQQKLFEAELAHARSLNGNYAATHLVLQVVNLTSECEKAYPIDWQHPPKWVRVPYNADDEA